MNVKGYELEDELISELGKFAVLWNLFEKEYCVFNCSSAKINALAGRIAIRAEGQDLLQKVLNDRRHVTNMIISVEDYVETGLYPENAHQSREDNKEKMKAFINGNGNEIGCLLIVERIRNNLMHGLKMVEQLNEQLDLFKAVNNVLENIEQKC